MRVFVTGAFWSGSLEEAYARAFETLGHKVLRWNLGESERRYIKGGRFGRYLHLFMPIEAWAAKANRELVVACADFSPDLIVTGGAQNIRVGALAQVRARFPAVQIVNLWPDPLLRLLPHVVHALPMYDLVAVFSRSMVPVFERLAKIRAAWVPFGLDRSIQGPGFAPITQPTHDIAFVGNWRPERERLLSQLYAEGFSIRLWGPSDWRRFSRDRRLIRECWTGEEVYGPGINDALHSGRFAINPVDATAYPGANMRFFEALASGAVALNSDCPEMTDVFAPEYETFYYKDAGDLIRRIRDLNANYNAAREVTARGLVKALAGHTYEHRVEQILTELTAAKNMKDA